MGITKILEFFIENMAPDRKFKFQIESRVYIP
jgi:hypothetical protein